MLASMGTRYTFGQAQFDPRRGVLTVSGQPSALRPQTAAVLEELLKRAAVLVTREELLGAVWPGRVVTQNSLEQCMSELRRDLAGSTGCVLRTVPRRGYVLEAQVRSAEAPPLAGANGSRSLVVLPLAADGRRAEASFAAALTRDLIAEIGRAPCVTVVAESTASSCARSGLDARRIGRELGVDYVVEGAVSREQAVWNVALCASETAEARQVWAERFQRRGGEVESRRSIAACVSSVLASELTAIESLRGNQGGARDAREMTKRSYFLLASSLPGMSEEALSLAIEAIEVDDHAPGPWAFIAYWHVSAVATRAATDRKASIAMAESAARRALALDPAHRLAYGALAGALLQSGRLDEAFTALDRQMALNPNVAGAHHLLGRLHLLRGEPKRARDSVLQALALGPSDPRRPAFLDTLALVHLHLGHDKRALEVARQSRAEPKPWPRSLETLAMALSLDGRRTEARAAVEALLVHWPDYCLAQHRAELASRRAAFIARHDRLLRALSAAGLPPG